MASRFMLSRMTWAQMAGKLVTVNEMQTGFMVNWLIPLLPRRSVLKMVRKMQTKKG